MGEGPFVPLCRGAEEWVAKVGFRFVSWQVAKVKGWLREQKQVTRKAVKEAEAV